MFAKSPQPGAESPKPVAVPVQISPVPVAEMKPEPAPPLSDDSTSQIPGEADFPQQQAQVLPPLVAELMTEGGDPEEKLDLPVSPTPREVVDPSDVVPEESLDLPVGEMPIPVASEGLPEVGQIQPQASDPTPQMRRYALPAPAVAGDPGQAVLVAQPVPFRRACWIVSRGAGGLQASYSEVFNQPDLVDVQVNGIPIPIFAGQYLWMRVINAAVGDPLEISIILEPRGTGR